MFVVVAFSFPRIDSTVYTMLTLASALLVVVVPCVVRGVRCAEQASILAPNTYGFSRPHLLTAEESFCTHFGVADSGGQLTSVVRGVCSRPRALHSTPLFYSEWG